MTKTSFIGMRFRERLLIVTTFPIAVFAFSVVRSILFDGGFLPLTVLILLALLTFAEAFNAFEIRRTNWALKSEIAPAPRPWFSSGFWTWEGVRERITSVRSWFVFLYVAAAAFFSSIGIGLMVCAWIALVVLLFATKVFTPGDWTQTFDVSDPDMSGQINAHVSNGSVHIVFSHLDRGTALITDHLSWTYTSRATIAISLGFIALSLALVPVIARQLRELAKSLLGDSGAVESFSSKLVNWLERRKQARTKKA